MVRRYRVRTREPRACQQCAYAKVKCEQQEADGCKRCSRLKRECISQPPGAHKRKATSPLDVARLEKKLNNMACLFGVSSQIRSVAASESEQANGCQAQSTSQLVLPWDESFYSTHENALVILTKYRTEMAYHCPCVVIPLEMTLPELQQKSPFLLSAIVMVTWLDDADRKKGMRDHFLEHVSGSIVMKGHKSLDIMQALLVCLSWYHFLFESEGQLSIISHLALAMLSSLGLHQRSNSTSGKVQQTWERDNARTTDERRAYLGCFYITCAITTCLKDTDPPRYTGYTEECCRVLEELQEYPTDIYLVRLARLSRMAHRIVQILSFDAYNPSQTGLSDSVQTCVKDLEAELKRLKPCSSQNSIQDSIMALKHHSLKLLLYESALDDDFSKENRNSTRILHSCLNSAKEFFSTFSSLAPQLFLYFPYWVYQEYYHAVNSFSRFLLLAGKGCDQINAPTTIDVSMAINMFVGKAEEAVKLSHLDESSLCTPEIIYQLISRVRAIEGLHEARCAVLRADSGVDSYDDDTMGASRNSIRDMTFSLPHGLSWQFLDSE